MRRRAVVGLDVVRVCAALMVVLYHLTYRISVPGSTGYVLARGHIAFPRIAPFTTDGWVGVPIFFVLSGFVIAYTANGAKPLAFLRSRLLRLLPATWLCATLTLTVMLAVPGQNKLILAEEWVRSITFFPLGTLIDGSYWTLGIECVFYAVIFLILCFSDFKRAGTVSALLTILSLSLWVVTVFGLKMHGPKVNDSRLLQLLLLVHGAEFALGMYMWLIFETGITPSRIVGVAAALVASSIQVLESSPVQGREASAWLIWLGAVFLMGLFIRYNERIHDMFGPRAVRLARTAGIITFPLYLIHQVVGSVIIVWLVNHQMLPLAAVGVALVLVVCIAIVVGELIEPQFRRVMVPVLDKLIVSVRLGKKPALPPMEVLSISAGTEEARET